MRPIQAAHPSERFRRQVLLPEVGTEGQAALSRARVLIVGLGGLGCPVALSLAASGVENLTLMDFDQVEMSNLHRQTLYGPADVGQNKVDVAADRLTKQMGLDTIRRLHGRICEDNVAALVASHDLVLDCSDNFRTRYLLGDTCRSLGRPLVTSALSRFSGQIISFEGHRGPCYRCLFPHPVRPGVVANCSSEGVLGTFAGLMGMMQAHEAIKVLLGLPVRWGDLQCVDGLSGQVTTLPVRSKNDCPACSMKPSRLENVPPWPLVLPENEIPETAFERDVDFFIEKLSSSMDCLLLDARTQAEFDNFKLPGARLLSERDACSHAQTLLVYCQSGRRSAQAVSELRGHGKQAFSLRGGLEALDAADTLKIGKAVHTLLAESFNAHDPCPSGR